MYTYIQPAGRTLLQVQFTASSLFSARQLSSYQPLPAWHALYENKERQVRTETHLLCFDGGIYTNTDTLTAAERHMVKVISPYNCSLVILSGAVDYMLGFVWFLYYNVIKTMTSNVHTWKHTSPNLVPQLPSGTNCNFPITCPPFSQHFTHLHKYIHTGGLHC